MQIFEADINRNKKKSGKFQISPNMYYMIFNTTSIKATGYVNIRGVFTFWDVFSHRCSEDLDMNFFRISNEAISCRTKFTKRQKVSYI